MGLPKGPLGRDLRARREIEALTFGGRFGLPHRLTAAAPAGDGFTLALGGGVRERVP